MSNDYPYLDPQKTASQAWPVKIDAEQQNRELYIHLTHKAQYPAKMQGIGTAMVLYDCSKLVIV